MYKRLFAHQKSLVICLLQIETTNAVLCQIVHNFIICCYSKSKLSAGNCSFNWTGSMLYMLVSALFWLDNASNQTTEDTEMIWICRSLSRETEREKSRKGCKTIEKSENAGMWNGHWFILFHSTWYTGRLLDTCKYRAGIVACIHCIASMQRVGVWPNSGPQRSKKILRIGCFNMFWHVYFICPWYTFIAFIDGVLKKMDFKMSKHYYHEGLYSETTCFKLWKSKSWTNLETEQFATYQFWAVHIVELCLLIL